MLLAYEHWLVRPDDLTRVNVAFFHVNAVVSIGLFAGRRSLDLLASTKLIRLKFAATWHDAAASVESTAAAGLS